MKYNLLPSNDSFTLIVPSKPVHPFQEIETQCESKQFHEQSCQSEDFADATSTPKQQKDTAAEQLENATATLEAYVEARQALLNWLEETEELVNNQKPPSGDYKVARAQLQNHDFQMKLIDDKQDR